MLFFKYKKSLYVPTLILLGQKSHYLAQYSSLSLIQRWRRPLFCEIHLFEKSYDICCKYNYIFITLIELWMKNMYDIIPEFGSFLGFYFLFTWAGSLQSMRRLVSAISEIFQPSSRRINCIEFTPQ